MKRIIGAVFIVAALLCLCSCGMDKNEQKTQDTVKNSAIEFAINVGEKHYNDDTNDSSLYKSFDTPQIVSVEVIEDKYYDLRCSVECVAYNSSASAEVIELFYSLRLEYDDAKNTFDILDEQYGGF